MAWVDWIILFAYIFFIIGLSYWIGKKQKNQEDYYVGGRRVPAWQVALSIMATQVSAISLIGAPAFVALRSGGGLRWLQYEFAVPLAMIAILWVMIPLYHRIKIITIYQYLEERFGPRLRLLVSLVFIFARGLGSGVALLATGIVTAVCLNLNLPETIILIGVVSLIYTTFGGIKADIYSDIIQLFILWGTAILSIFIVTNYLGWEGLVFTSMDSARLRVFDWQHTGLGDGHTFSFWAMLFGGFFLYVSYYGADQSQTQRLLATKSSNDASHTVFLNGILRFPLVLTYLALGVLLIPFLNTHTEFARSLAGKPADFLVPQFLIHFVPPGALGLIIAGIFAASMSSLDSAMNSLSAATYQDVLFKWKPQLRQLNARMQVRLSRALTVFWGTLATVFALWLAGGEETVIELVNKIGSAFYGPVLGVFWLGMLTTTTGERSATIGLLAGVLVNILLWQFFQASVSWLWWNGIGFGVTFLTARAISGFLPPESSANPALRLSRDDLLAIFKQEKTRILLLVFAFIGILLISTLIEWVL